MGLRKFDDNDDQAAEAEARAEGRGLPPGADAEQIVMAALQPFIKQALDSAISDLTERARAAIREERQLGRPGPKWEELKDKVSFYTKIPKERRLELILVIKLIFLLTGAIEMVGRDTPINPEEHDYPED